MGYVNRLKNKRNKNKNKEKEKLNQGEVEEGSALFPHFLNRT